MLELYESIDKETPEDVPEELDNQKKRAKQFEYQDAPQTGDTGALALVLYKKEIEEAENDRDEKQKMKDEMVALDEEIQRKPELRPRIPAGAEITEGRMTIINDAMRSLRDRMDSIYKQM
ncbi:hypothetical protein J4E91_005287 [Alternaria rosae]|nr:hypothetical protein J4E91_005287 [Alternaria rosae]